MTELAPPHRPAWPSTVVLALATAALVVAATLVMFSTFMVYDDEGYVLLSLRNFAEHGGLYRDVYTQYGPFPFVVYYALQVIGIPLTHTIGRLITIGAWTTAALCCVAVVGHVTRSLIIRLSVLTAVFVYLWVMASEPTHPGGIIAVLTTLLAALGYHWIRTDRESRWAIVTGAVIAALLLTKINIGVFAAFSAGSWLLLHHRNVTVRAWAPTVVSIAAILLPIGLMRPLLGTPWVRTFAFVFGTSSVALILAATAGATARVGWRALGQLTAAAAAMGGIVIGVVLLRGTTPRDLVEGVLLGPLRHPTNFSLRFVWPPGIEIIAVLSAAFGVAAFLLRRRAIGGIDLAIAVLRLIVVTAFALNTARYPAINPDYLALGYLLPCLWLFVWPLARETGGATGARTWIALLLLGQSLHAFPVPGSQIAWGTVLAIPLAALGAWDAAVWLARRIPDTWLASRQAGWLAQGIVLIFTVFVAGQFARVATRYQDGQYLALPGAETIRLPDNSAARYRVLTVNAIAHADVLFSLPGMFSFNLWTELPTPTHANVTHWFSLLDESQQREIIRSLEAHPRSCVIVDHGHVDFLAERGLTPRGLVRDYIEKNYEPAFWLDRFAFCVRRGRKIEPFMVGDLLTRAEGASGESALLKFSLLLPPRGAVTSIELVASKPVVLNASNTRVEIAPASPRGETAGPAQPASWPLKLSGPAIVSLYFNREGQPPLGSNTTIILRDAAGNEVGLAWLRR